MTKKKQMKKPISSVEQVRNLRKLLSSEEKTKIINDLRKLLNRSLNLNNKILYEWKITFYWGLLMNILFLMLGLLIGVLYG